jgi:hypothetical protein
VALQTFTAGQVLTAAQVTALQANDYNQQVNNYTDSRVLTIADLGDRVVMNKATATTITVNTGIFAAGDTLWIHNIGAGVTTITAGTATVSTSGSLALAQNSGGTLYFTSTGVAIFFPTVAASAQGLTLLNTTSFSGVASVSLPANTFSSTYDNYRIIFTDIKGSANDTLKLRWRKAGVDTTTSIYYSSIHITTWGGLAAAGATAAAANASIILYLPTTFGALSFDVLQPLVRPMAIGLGIAAGPEDRGGYFNAYINGSDTYDSATFFPNSGTITGKVTVFGYNK